jgi:hypothetical protein
MGRKGVSKRKPKKSGPLSNANTGRASNTRSGEHSVVASLVRDSGALPNRGSMNPSAGSNKKVNKA